ncbi:triose-phosphate isomerase family protein, partial [Nonomuraea sp. NPDC004297]
MTQRKPLIAGNWKMNLNHFEAIKLVQKLAFALKDKDFDKVEVAVLPPFTDLRSVQTLVDGDKLRIVYGAQDLSEHDAGAYTGEVSGAMLAKLGCTYVTVGHSERRQYHREDDEVVNAKMLAAVRHSLTPILCVGEA